MCNGDMAAAPSPLPQRCSHQPCPTLPPSPCSFPSSTTFGSTALRGEGDKSTNPPAQLSPLQHRLRQPLPLRDPEQMEPKGFGLPVGPHPDPLLQGSQQPRSRAQNTSPIPSGTAFPGLTQSRRSRDRPARLSAHPAPQSSLPAAGH